MKKKHLILLLLIFIILPFSSNANWKADFWNTQKKGAHGDGGAAKVGGANPNDWFKSAHSAGLDFVRLCPVDWKGEGRDFLIGNADKYTSIPEKDLKKLKHVLDIAHRNQVKVVLTMFSLPGARYKQDNNNRFDYRLWTDEKFQKQALRFWKDLASELKNHPAIVGYNPFNEPYPSRKSGFEEGEKLDGFEKWLKNNKGKPSDLNSFNKKIVQAIRLADANTPIILDCWFHSDPEGFRYLNPVNDKATLYAFHYYGPWNFATYRINKKRFSYPDKMPVGWSGKTEKWTGKNIEKGLHPIMDWAKRHNIPASRIIAEEFGCDRRIKGVKEFFTDLISVFNKEKWHWAFFSFRSSTWDGLDYELGTKPIGWKYWQGRDKGIDHEKLVKRKDNPLWSVFKKELSN